MSSRSGLQGDVLALYRSLIRSARKKVSSKSLLPFVSKEFRLHALAVPKSDFKTIEYKLRYGYKQKKLIDMPGFVFAQSAETMK